MAISVRVADTKISCGGFYRSPDGRVACVCGWSGPTKIVLFIFDDDTGINKLPEADFSTWEPLPDLEDFPCAKDPRLPYEFDLVWDVKTRSGLVRLLANPKDIIEGTSLSDVREAMSRYGLVLTPDEEIQVCESKSAPSLAW